jgi:Flp pilus assembly protein TadG
MQSRLGAFWKSWRLFPKAQKGNVAISFAIAAIPFSASFGAAVDYSRASSARAAMQAAADATALVLAKHLNMSGTAMQASPAGLFNANFNRVNISNIQVTALYGNSSDGTTVTVSSKGVMQTAFGALLGMSTVEIGARAIALSVRDGLGCVLALNSLRSGAAAAQGSVNVNLKGCSLYDNSRDASALTVSGSAKLTALSVNVVGNISGASNISTTQGLVTGASPIADPYAEMSFPTAKGCTENRFSAKTAVTISPGVYCGGMMLTAGADVTLNPGIYYIVGGDLQVNGGAILTGKGVTLVFTSSNGKSWPTATINGGATINLTSPNSGPTQGIVIFGDRNMPEGTAFKFNGGSTQIFGGAIYLPKAAVSYAGGSNTSTSCTQLIADMVTWTGNANFAINCSSYGIKPLGSQSVRLIS